MAAPADLSALSQQQTAKLVLLGEQAAGKSSLVLRYVKGQFFDYQVRACWSLAGLPFRALMEGRRQQILHMRVAGVAGRPRSRGAEAEEESGSARDRNRPHTRVQRSAAPRAACFAPLSRISPFLPHPPTPP